MGFDADAVRIEDQCIAGDSRRSLIGLAEAPVDADFLAFRSNRAFALLDLNRRVAVDDVPLRRIDAEFMKDLDAFILISGF